MSDVAGLQVEQVKLTQQGRLRAYVAIKIGWVEIHDFRVVENADGRLVVMHPRRLVEDMDGRPAYHCVLTMNAEKKDDLDAAILTAYHAASKKTEREELS